MVRFFFLIPVLTLLFSAQAQQIKGKHIMAETVTLTDNFELHLGTDTTEVPGVYEQLIVKHNGKVVYFDSTTFYFFQETEYPMLLKTGTNDFELLLESDGRPQNNYLTLFEIRNDSVISTDMVPLFIRKAANLDKDSIFELAGSIGFPELSETYMPYSPILYYELRPEGLVIDSVLTTERNKFIYNGFYGFEYREEQHQPLNRMLFYDAEINRIKNAK